MDEVELLTKTYELNKEKIKQSKAFTKLFKKVYLKLSSGEKKYLDLYKSYLFDDLNVIYYNREGPITLNYHRYKNLLKLKIKSKKPKKSDLPKITEKAVKLLVKINKTLDKIIAKCPKINVKRLYRGMANASLFLKAKPGNIYTFANILSTSYSVNVAAKFAMDYNDGVEDKAIFVIDIKSKIKALLLPWDLKKLGDNNVSYDECEMLLPRGAVVRFDEIKKQQVNVGGTIDKPVFVTLAFIYVTIIDFIDVDIDTNDLMSRIEWAY
jgi:hypothetical protein